MTGISNKVPKSCLSSKGLLVTSIHISFRWPNGKGISGIIKRNAG
jgi:hypothetical protein